MNELHVQCLNHFKQQKGRYFISEKQVWKKGKEYFTHIWKGPANTNLEQAYSFSFNILTNIVIFKEIFTETFLKCMIF